MGSSPYFDKFLKHECYIDTDMITSTTVDNGPGWLLSDPSTWVFSRMKLNSNTKSPYSHRRQPATHIAPVTYTSSTELQRQGSMSSLSNPGLMEDQRNSWTESEASFLETQASSMVSSPQLPYYEDWNSWFPETPNNFSEETLPLRDSKLSTWNRNFATTNLANLDGTKSPTLLSKVESPRSPHRTPKPKPSLSAFPSTSPDRKPATFAKNHQTYPAHKSWSVETQTERPSLRSRSNTTPANTKTNRPSNLSTCSTLDNDSTSSRSPSSLSTSTTSQHLYMRSPPPTPLFPTTSGSTSYASRSSSSENHSALNAYISTKSFFFHDDDDNTKEASWLDAQRRKFVLLTSPRTRHPSTLPSLHDPPTLRAADHYYSSKTRKESKSKKDAYPAERNRMLKKKSTLGLRADKCFREMFGRGSKKDCYDLFEEGRDGEVKERVYVEDLKLKKEVTKLCPKCKWSLEKKGDHMMVTCWCRSDLCFGCLRDWDFCEGTCC